MATTKFKGQPVKVIGEFIKVGSVAWLQQNLKDNR